jgi:hypothetical protein
MSLANGGYRGDSGVEQTALQRVCSRKAITSIRYAIIHSWRDKFLHHKRVRVALAESLKILRNLKMILFCTPLVHERAPAKARSVLSQLMSGLRQPEAPLPSNLL